MPLWPTRHGSAIHAGCATRWTAKRFALCENAKVDPNNRPEATREKRDEKMKNVVRLVAAAENNPPTLGTVGLPFLSCHGFAPP